MHKVGLRNPGPATQSAAGHRVVDAERGADDKSFVFGMGW